MPPKSHLQLVNPRVPPAAGPGDGVPSTFAMHGEPVHGIRSRSAARPCLALYLSPPTISPTVSLGFKWRLEFGGV